MDGFTPPSYPYTRSCAAGPVRLEAVPALGYEFVEWSGGLSGSENPTVITMDSVKEVTANFAQITYALTVSVSLTNGGTVTLEPSQPAKGYAMGTEVTLTATASQGYKFDHWSGALSGSENPTTITMDSAKEVTAYFIEVTSSFPWWWAVLGIVVVGLPFYFLVTGRLWT